MGASRFRTFAVVASSGLLVAGVGTVAAFGATRPADSKDGPRFATRCNLSHQLADDPIVKPGLPGASHSHDFFANTTTNAFSTLTSLTAGHTTCVNRLDKSGYWVPSLTVAGATVLPSHADVYYQSSGKPQTKVKTIPRGLDIVAGDAHAITPQPTSITAWDCGPKVNVARSATVPTCPTPTLMLHVNFPDCWNGKTLDSPDHKSHLAYHVAGGACPAGFPVPIPKLRVNVSYPITGGPGVALASGGQFSGHADFFNAWDAAELQRLVRKCIAGGLVCDVNA